MNGDVAEKDQQGSMESSAGNSDSEPDFTAPAPAPTLSAPTPLLHGVILPAALAADAGHSSDEEPDFLAGIVQLPSAAEVCHCESRQSLWRNAVQATRAMRDAPFRNIGI